MASSLPCESIDQNAVVEKQTNPASQQWAGGKVPGEMERGSLPGDFSCLSQVVGHAFTVFIRVFGQI